LLQTEPVALDRICAEPNVHSWRVIGDEGQPIAISRGACLGKEPRGYHVISQWQPLEADAPRWEFHLWLGSDGAPRQAQLRVATMVRRFWWTPDGLSTSIFGDTEPIDAPEGAWVLPAEAPYLDELRRRLGVGVGASEPAFEHVTVRAETGEVIEERWMLESGADAPVLRSDRRIDHLRGSTLSQLELLEVTTLDGAPLLTPARGDALAPVLDEVPRPTYVAPEDLEIVPVVIGGDPALAGEIVRTAGGEARRPGVVFISGSGPQDRHGFVPGTSIDVGSHELHDALARAGFAVLRFDDRGVGASGLGDTATPGYDAIVDDARRAVRFMADRDDVDARRLIVIGHSEGALTATILGREAFGRQKRRLAGIVLMAGTGRNLRDVIYSQLRGATDDPTAADDAVKQAKEIHEAVLNDGDLPAATEPVRMYLKEIFAQDPVENLERVKAPVLVAQGSKDFQVDPELDFEPLRDTVARHGGKHGDAKLFAGLDHLFKPEPGESTVGHYADMRRRVDASFIEHVVTWARARANLE